MIFAVTSIRNVVSIENEMKNPEHFLGPLGVLNVSSYIIATLCVIVGFFGFSRFGYSIKGSITLNLPDNEPLALLTQVLIGVAIFFSMGLMIHTAMEVIGKKWGEVIYKEKETPKQISLRIGIVLLLSIFAVLVPNLKVFISLTGVVFLGSLSILIPAIIETIHRFPTRRYGLWNWKLFMNIFLIFFYLLTLITGVLVDVGEIVKIYTD
jgi:proton-coupled amino acid transporter